MHELASYTLYQTRLSGKYTVTNVLISPKQYKLKSETDYISHSGAGGFKNTFKRSKFSTIRKITFTDTTLWVIFSQFSIDTSDKANLNLGNKDRIADMNETLKYVVDKQGKDKNFCVILGGDLNFRVDLEGKEQLSTYLSSVGSKIQGLNVTNLTKDIGYTCKTVKSGKSTDECISELKDKLGWNE